VTIQTRLYHTASKTFILHMMNLSTITTTTITEEMENIVTHETIWPTQMEEKALLVLVTVFYVVVFVSGLLGNLSVCLVIIKSTSLHSAMNYYLISLAVADITIIILGVPDELRTYWMQYPYPFGECFCMLRSFLSESASYANVLTILAFSLERFLAICRPLYVFPLSELRRAVLVSSLCWAISMLASVPHLLFTRIVSVRVSEVSESTFCAMLDENFEPKWYPVHELSFIFFFLIPIIILVFLYISMVKVIMKAGKSKIRKSTYRQNGEAGQPRDNNKQIIRMLVSVVILFFISWAPFHFQRLEYVYFKHVLSNKTYATFNQYLMYFSGCFYYLSSTLNPVLYNLMSTRYREACKAVMLCRAPASPASNTARQIMAARRTSQGSDMVDMNRNKRMLVKPNRSSSLDTSSTLLKTSMGRQLSLGEEGRTGSGITLSVNSFPRLEEETEQLL